MAMEEDLIARLGADSAVAALVGARIGWGGRWREDALPVVVLTMVYPGRDYDHAGPDGLDNPRVQFDCLAQTAITAAALKRAVTACMETPATVGGTRFWNGFLEGESWIDEGEQDGGEPLFRVSLDFTFMHEEA